MAQSESPRDEVYRALPDADAEGLRGSRQSLSKPKEKAADGASEKLLSKEMEARIVSHDNMADAKYVVGDHRNGDANIEIDATKRTFTGLTKEELLRYQDDPFWVRLRWTMFALFWALWVCMLVGAIVIIVNSPKCAAAEPKKWIQQGPLVELDEPTSLQDVEDKLPQLGEARAGAVLVPAALAGGVYDERADLAPFTDLVAKAKDVGVKIIVELTANFVNKSHEWFASSERSEGNYTDYFVWAPSRGKRSNGTDVPPNSWVSTLNEPAWTCSEVRQACYLHQYSADTPDLNFHNPRVVEAFDGVIRKWVKAGVAGIRLQKARQLLVDPQLQNDHMVRGGTDLSFTEYDYYSHRATSDRPELLPLLQRWRQLASDLDSEFVLTMEEPVPLKEPYFARDADNRTLPVLELPAAGAVSLAQSPRRLGEQLNRLLGHWPAVQFVSDEEAVASNAAVLGLLLPATPVLTWDQIFTRDNNTWKVDPAYKQLVALRSEPVLMRGEYSVASFANGTLLGCTRWLAGKAGYAVVYNPGAGEAAGDAAELPRVPASVSVVLLSGNYNVPNVTVGSSIRSQDLVLSPRSAVVFTFVPLADK